ncbi:MAG: LL-diaminopimelate aminotransferase [Clostridia bacterium]|nr:LL-diaminopimelate aminotransferase [Clostridia bacterium]
MKINSNYLQLKDSYLFSKISQKVNAYSKANPDKKIIRMGIGDVTLPLAPVVIDAMHNAVTDMGNKATFKGYGEEQGYAFLRNAIAAYYARKNVTLSAEDIFVSDGAKSDLGNILDLFDCDNTVLVPNPVYPVYVDTNIMAGRKIIYGEGNQANGFLPMPDSKIKADIIYICSPNNPTGAVYNSEQLEQWVKYANSNDAVILFDAAYEAFVNDSYLPTSIYQIEGAKKCAIEFCSLSKTAGFTGTRCGYTVVPQELVRENVALNKLWLRRQTTKFNGVSYIIQKGAEAVFSEKGIEQTREAVAYYMQNAAIIGDALARAGIWFCGGVNSPYIWLKCPDNMGSWEFFDYLLENINIVGTPGAGFGTAGEGYFRFTAFGNRENISEASEKLLKVFGK